MGNAPEFETALGLNQGVNQAPQSGAAAAAAKPFTADGGCGTASQASQPGAAAAAAGPLAADGGGGTDPKAIELARKISAMEAQIEQLEQRNAILEVSIRTPNSEFASAISTLKQCAPSLTN